MGKAARSANIFYSVAACLLNRTSSPILRDRMDFSVLGWRGVVGTRRRGRGGQSEIYVCEKMIYIYYVACKLVSLFSLSSFLSSAAAGFGKTPRSREGMCVLVSGLANGVPP